MKKIFINPEVRITEFLKESVITASGVTKAQQAMLNSGSGNIKAGNVTVVDNALTFSL